ncbi:MAG TPA: DUF4173 domain-containing protein [Kiritimatiellia bacterium]|nr:DUF4173 domain-containing protein [Kiritimatiellia bacterium]HSA19269.1 DUF4173 domain-containing protein [Kiritimatiellia bacterium]
MTPRPVFRLALVILLGLLGTWLMPVHDGFIPLFLAGDRGWEPAVWLAVAAAALWLVHRREGISTPRPFWLIVGVAMVLAAVPLPAFQPMHSFFYWPAVAKTTGVGLILLFAGTLAFGRPGGRWHAPFLALASPLLLFASRPPPGGGRLKRALFAVLVLILAVPWLSFARDCWPRALWRIVNMDDMGRLAVSFRHWAWAGCAFLFILSPWREEVWLDQARPAGRLRWGFVLAAAILVVLALLPLALHKGYHFKALLMYAGLILLLEWASLVLLLMLGPRWPVRFVPRLAALPPATALGWAWIAGFLLLALVPSVLYFSGAIRAVVTGSLFAEKFDHSWVGWCLDQSTLQCGFWRFTMIAALLMVHVAIARWLGDRTSRRGLWTFRLLAIALFIGPLCYLACDYWSLIVYIRTLGFTLLRVYGLVYGLAAALATLGFLRWAVRYPAKKPAAAGAAAGL